MIHSFTRAGSYHQAAGAENQDFVFSGTLGKFSAISLADGVSSCRMSREGAETACVSFTELMLKKGESFFGNTDRQTAAKMILAHIRGRLAAKSASQDITEYSSTIAGVLYDSERSRMLCFSVGDGMIAALSEKGCRVLLRPCENPKGCCSTTTLNAHRAAGLEVFSTVQEDSVIIFSDGAWRQIYRDKKFSLLEGGLKISELDEYFAGAACYDDCSYIALKLKGGIHMSRSKLTDSIELFGESSGNRFSRRFFIRKVLGEGAQVISYEAYHSESSYGVLSEFYPYSAWTLERNPDGQIVCPAEFQDARNDFTASLEKFTALYTELMNLKRSDSSKDLAVFIPPFEIYYGRDTVYIWNPIPKLYTFDKFCSEVHSHPKIGAKYRLIQILGALKTLTECLQEIHAAGLVHRDITPANFGFTERREAPVVQALSLFDVDTVIKLDDVEQNDSGFYEIAGTPGYIEPEAGRMPPRNQSDIYSIGAVMFHAVACAENEVYKAEYFPEIDGRVKSSALVRASKISPELQAKIAEAMKKCLCPRNTRYASCEELLDSLNAILSESGSLEDAYINFRKDSEDMLLMTMQAHIFRHTLYEKSKGDFRVLIAGFDVYAQKFLDACLQAGQIPGIKFTVHVLYTDIQEKYDYLNARPALPKFFCVDGNANPESYGTVIFSEFTGNIALDAFSPSYAFISLGSNGVNLQEAEKFAEAFTDCSVNFVQCGEVPENSAFAGINPVYVEADVSDPEIERMALNVHLVWEKNWGKSHSAVLEEFGDPYNHMSCVSNVMSLKYKLFSIGIDMDALSLTDAAEKFVQAVNEKKDLLIWAEHKRWVTERLCEGCTVKLPEECSCEKDRQERNARNRVTRHICLVKSRPDQKLITDWHDDAAKWNSADTSGLDELDRMSAELHRVFMRNAERAEDINGVAEEIRQWLRHAPECAAAFEELYSCMRDIRSGVHDSTAQAVRDKVSRYVNLRENFDSVIGDVSDSAVRAKFLELSKNFAQKFAPVLESMRFRDFKKDDIALIENIPFILTYRTDINLVVPYERNINNPTGFFGNTASALLINPKRLIFVCDGSAFLGETFPKISAVMKSRNMRAEIQAVIVGAKNRSVDFPGVVYVEDVASAKKYISSIPDGVTVIEKNSAGLSKALGGTFRFDSGRMAFTECTGYSRVLRHITKKPSITVYDMFGAKRAASSCEKSNVPEFFTDYKFLWGLYVSDPYAWKIMCKVFGEHMKAQDVIAEFCLKQKDSGSAQELVYILPAVCRASAEYIISGLVKYGIIGESSCVEGAASDSCRAVIFGGSGLSGTFDGIFSQQDILRSADAFRIYTAGAWVNVSHDWLNVFECEIPDEIQYRVLDILSELRAKGYVYAVSADEDGKMSLTFATRQIKELLTKAGRILEVYVYHEARRISAFSDVVSSFELQDREGRSLREMDCIITRGFRSLFIECKAQYELEEEYYARLRKIAGEYGINAKMLVVADTLESANGQTAQKNQRCREYGRSLGIETVYRREDIEAIGNRLVEIMS